MIQPTRVLPSNAPPLAEDDVHLASRILQEHSGNRQQNDLGFQHDYEQKYPSSILTENTYPRHQLRQQQQQTQHLYHPQPQHRQQWRYGYGRGIHNYNSPEREARIQFEAERLYRRFRQSDQYNKYRTRQSKDNKGNGDQKWPDHLEKAFFWALVTHPPMGRRKLLHKDKQRGRNELIADCIEEMTGEARSRKQVSSHIQVLKPFVENDPVIMKYLSKEDMGMQAGRSHGQLAGYGGGRRMSNYPVTALPPMIRTNMPTLPRPDPFALQKAKANSNIFEPIDFQMFVQRKQMGVNGEEVERLHTYTKSLIPALGPEVRIQDWETVHHDFPLLSAMHEHRPLDCNVLIADASLAFPKQTSWKNKDGQPLTNVELGIFFLCNSRYFAAASKDGSSPVKFYNNFFENKFRVEVEEGTKPGEPIDVDFRPSETGEGVDTQLKFGSKFWARTLSRLTKLLLDTSKDQKDEVSSSLKALRAVQEVFVATEHGRERILVIHWTFRQSSTTCGRASWRRLILPTSQTLPYDNGVKMERADSFDCYAQYPDPTTSQQQQEHSLPALQSPFEYDSGSGSALSSATWPTSISEGSVMGQHSGHPDFATDNAFDFNSGSINIAYDPNLTFDNFDSSAFDFDTTAVDFAADPALQDFSQQWCNTQTNGYDGHDGVDDGTGFTAQADMGIHGHLHDNDFAGQFDQHSYGGTHDQQAYGGAGPDLMKDEDALAALADASFMASAMGQKQGPMY